MQSKYQGFSLIEMLISTVLSLMLLAGLGKLYLSVKENFRLQSAFALIQEDARFTFYYLQRRIHMAGYTRCNDKVKGFAPITVYAANAIARKYVSGIVRDTDALVIAGCVHYRGKKQFMQTTYYIGKTNRKDSKTALYAKPLGGRREEIVDHVINMKLEYRKQSCGVEIRLLFVSTEPILFKPETYHFAGQKIQASDRLLHKQWIGYVASQEP